MLKYLLLITIAFVGCGSKKTHEQNTAIGYDSLYDTTTGTSGWGTTGTVDNMLGHCTLDTSKGVDTLPITKNNGLSIKLKTKQ